ncbi:MAG TPA: peptidylprolyl isomerase [Acidimicrobiales bacterium]|nr:peptidylprolyl isomerase [Acidimicrobiales bacterium]
MPTDKRARHKAYRQAKQAQLRRAQQRRRNLRRGGVVAGVVVVALVVAALTAGGGGKKKSTVATNSGTATSTTTVPPGAGSAAASPVSASVAAALTPRTPPARSAACSNPSTASTSTSTTTVPAKGNAVSIVPAPAKIGFPDLNGSSPRYTKFSSAPPFCINVNDKYVATMKTTAGTMRIQLLPRYAPVTVNNFVFLAGYHYFDGIVFHRVIPGFMDQGGDPTGTGTGGPGYEFKDELPKSAAAYDAGALAMANSGPNTNGSQFFITVGKGGQQLQPSYTMFGQVVSGMSVDNKINAGGNPSPSANGVPPKTLYKILSVSISATPVSS